LLQEGHSRNDKKLTEEINAMLDTRPPLWIVANNGDMTNVHLKKVLKEQYILRDKTQDFRLYRLKEAK
jgi:hypothetical protein